MGHKHTDQAGAGAERHREIFADADKMRKLDRLFGSLLVASALDQNVEHDAGLVHGSPQPMLHSGNFEYDLIEMPFVANPRKATTDPVGELLAEFARPLPHGFVADDDAAAASNSSTMRRPSGKRK